MPQRAKKSTPPAPTGASEPASEPTSRTWQIGDRVSVPMGDGGGMYTAGQRTPVTNCLGRVVAVSPDGCYVAVDVEGWEHRPVFGVEQIMLMAEGPAPRASRT
jgi:hypothetical protein